MTFDEDKVRRALSDSWSLQTARQWTEARPFDGQCNVTAAVIEDLFGGEILKTPWNEVTDHYYNRIEGVVYDLTDDQFDTPIHYENTPTIVENASQGFTESEYDNLKQALRRNLVTTS